MRLLILFFPICLIGMALVWPVPNQPLPVQSTYTGIPDPPVCESLCMAVKTNAKMLRSGIVSTQIQAGVQEYQEIKMPKPVRLLSVESPGAIKETIIVKDTTTNQ